MYNATGFLSRPGSCPFPPSPIPRWSSQRAEMRSLSREALGRRQKASGTASAWSGAEDLSLQWRRRSHHGHPPAFAKSTIAECFCTGSVFLVSRTEATDETNLQPERLSLAAAAAWHFLQTHPCASFSILSLGSKQADGNSSVCASESAPRSAKKSCKTKQG